MNAIKSTAGAHGAPILRTLRKDISEQDVSTSHFQGRGSQSSPRSCSFFPAPRPAGVGPSRRTGRNCREVLLYAVRDGEPCRYATRR